MPLTVNFSSAGSLDEDPGESIRYEWDFGDGSPISEEANPTHTYTKAGRFTAVLTVIDSSGKRTSTSTPITVGNTAPTVTVTVPIAGGTFAFGDKIPYVVTVTDPDDGTVLCSDILTTFVLGHDTHGHGEEEKTGCSGNLQTIADDVSHGGNVFGIISATYTDKGGRGANSAAAADDGRADEDQPAQAGGRARRHAVRHEHRGQHRRRVAARTAAASRHGDWIQLNGPYNLTNINSITYRVADTAAGRTAGSPLAAIEVRQDSITGPILATHNLVSTGATDVWSSQTFPIAMDGTHEIFLVFRAVTNGQTGTTCSTSTTPSSTARASRS